MAICYSSSRRKNTSVAFSRPSVSGNTRPRASCWLRGRAGRPDPLRGGESRKAPVTFDLGQIVTHVPDTPPFHVRPNPFSAFRFA